MNIPVQHYLGTQYEQGARGPDRFDCWGLVREILLNHFEVPGDHIPSFGHVPDKKKELTRCKNQIEHHFQKTTPAPGAIACHQRHGILFHVGVVVPVDEQLMVLHTSRRIGPSLDHIRKFEHQRTTEYFIYDN